MSLLGRILGRIVTVVIGYLVASLAAGLTIVMTFVGVSAVYGWQEPSAPVVSQMVFVSGVFAAFISVLAVAPAVIAVIVGEVFALRRMLYYTLAGGLSGALGYVAFTDFGLNAEAPPGAGDELLAVVAAGLVAGFVYWLVAGRTAGIFARAPA